MTTRSKLNIVAITALSFLLAVPSLAFAGKSGGGGKSGANSGPKESLTLNYGSTKHTYKPQTTSSRKGKATFHDLSITHKVDKASP
jgi:type VI protein secretion system component Hcp